MTDYSALTDRELDKLVAERLGWTGLRLDRQFDGVEWSDVWVGIRPDGDEDNVPRYSTDANAALALIKSTFRLETGRAASDRVMWRANVMLDEAFWVTGDTPARAIVLAWLAWKGA